MWLPALCRKQEVPYVVVKGRALLGKLCGFKQAAAVCFDRLNEEDVPAFKKNPNNAKTK